MSIEKVKEIVDMFNNGELNIKAYFGDYDKFFSFLKQRNALHLIDPINGPDADDWQNEFLIWQHENDYETFKKNVALVLGDVVVENGVPYLVDENLGDLSELFCDNRNDIALSTIKQILNGEYDSDYYYDTTIDVYKDVIDELTPKNTQHLYDYIVKALEGIQISPETDVLETIAEEQGHPEYVDVNAQTVIKIVDDEETMNSLLGDELSDLKGELYSIHSSAYNSAYESEIYRGIINKLGDYFEMENLEWGTRPHRYKKDTPVQTFKIPIVDFDTIILDYLDANKGYGNSGTLEYLGSFVSIIRDGQDCLSYYAPDYPDYRLIDKNINEFFGDYIY
jgi:hypothetical protein